jgi:hypothetical protein
MWASMVYVVHEGFVDLDIEDARLQRATKATDVALLNPDFPDAQQYSCTNRQNLQ